MATNTVDARVADMTRAELENLIEETVERLVRREPANLPYVGKNLRVQRLPNRKYNARPLDEVYTSIDRNMWVSPDGTPSTAEIIREDRDTR